MVMTKEQFKKRWESDENGGGITNDDCADCYVAWGLGSKPRCKPINEVVSAVVKFAGVTEEVEEKENKKEKKENKKMKSISIQGKKYVMVNERIKEFRENDKYKGWSLESEIIKLDENVCVIKAIVKDLTGTIRATGLAQEDKGSSFINKTSFVENCETSAWGRALGCLGIGIDESIASAEEVTIAIAKQINEPQEIIGADFVMPVGKHSGDALKDIDKQYLQWFLDNGNNENIKANIRKFFNDSDVGSLTDKDVLI